MTTTLSENERLWLQQLYDDGAWTVTEAHANLREERTQELESEGLLVQVPTSIGTLYLHTPQGRKAVFGNFPQPLRASTLINRAYLRLCAQDYGWTPADLSLVPIDLTQFDRSKRGVQYVTPQGLTLAFGSITHPLSLQYLNKLNDRYRALALRHRIRITVFTHEPRRGQEFARRHANYFDVIHHLPNQEFDQPNRHFQVTEEWARYSEATTPHDSPAITPIDRDQLQKRGYPPLALDTLMLPLRERIERAQADLSVDGVMSYGQLLKHYRLNIGDMIGTTIAQDYLRPVHSKRQLEIEVTFICASKKLARTDATRLAHRAGTAELRHLLGAPADDRWIVESRNTHRSEEPDAYWQSEQGLTAIEYDTGSYDATTIRFKVRKFQEKGARHIVWGVPTIKRQQNLAEKFGLDTRLCDWWSN